MTNQISPESATSLIARADKYLNTGSGEYASEIMRDMAEFIRRLPRDYAQPRQPPPEIETLIEELQVASIEYPNPHDVRVVISVELRNRLVTALSAGHAQTPAVRPMEWDESEGQLTGQRVWSSGDPWVFWIVKNPGEQYIWCENFNIEGWCPASPVRGSFDTLQDAKGAAQADYAKRILAALADTSTDRPVSFCSRCSGRDPDCYICGVSVSSPDRN